MTGRSIGSARFQAVNERNLQSDLATVRAQAQYLAGIYAAFQGRKAEAAASLRRSLATDSSSLWARRALAWLEMGLLTNLGGEQK